MTSAPSAGNALLRAVSKTLLVVGVLVFLFGDRFLREFYHADFVTAELAGIGGGLVIAILGAALKPEDGARK